MQTGELGKVYQDGETIINQGTQGDCIYVIQEGKVEVFEVVNQQEICLAELGEGDFFGEMAVFERTVRSTSVRALGQVRVLTVDKRTLLRRMQEDPSLSFRFLQIMSSRLRGLDVQLAKMHNAKKQTSVTEMVEPISTSNIEGTQHSGLSHIKFFLSNVISFLQQMKSTESRRNLEYST